MALDFNRTLGRTGCIAQYYALAYNTAVADEHGAFLDYEPSGAYHIDKVGAKTWTITYKAYAKDQVTGKTVEFGDPIWVGDYATLKDAKAEASDHQEALRTVAGQRTYILKDSTVTAYGIEYSDSTWLEYNTYTGLASLHSVCTAPGVRGHNDTIYLSGELAALQAALAQAQAEPGARRRAKIA